MLPWFCGSLGYARPLDSSASDFVLDLVNVSFEKEGLTLLAAPPTDPSNTPHATTPGGVHAHDHHDDDDALDLSASACSSSSYTRHGRQQQQHPKGQGPGAAAPVGAGGGPGQQQLSTMRTVAELDEAARRFQASSLLVELRALEVLYAFHLTALGVYGNNNHHHLDNKASSSSSPARRGPGGVGGLWGWWRSSWSVFRLLTWRAVINYVRNPGNVLARLFVTALTAVLHGLAFWRLDEADASNRLGSLYFGCTSLSLLPYASMSLFIYDRQFFAKDSAAGLYGVLPYFLSSVLLEAALLTATGLLYGAITAAMVGQVVPGQGSRGVLCGVYVLHSLVSSQFVQLMAIVAPNQDTGFVAGAGYTSASMLVCGFLVAFPQLGPGLRWMQWAAFMKYSFAALAMNEFRGTPTEQLLVKGLLDLERPSSIGQQLACLAGFGAGFAALSVLGLTYLHKERR